MRAALNLSDQERSLIHSVCPMRWSCARMGRAQLGIVAWGRCCRLFGSYNSLPGTSRSGNAMPVPKCWTRLESFATQRGQVSAQYCGSRAAPHRQVEQP